MPKKCGYKAKNKNNNSQLPNAKDYRNTNSPYNSPDNFREEFAAEWRENAIAEINKQSDERVNK
ncbi:MULTISPECIES: hypothetical protein [Rummeliibacillus]|uniref:Uncharacterized protein n=1 Tax=Rummeliibacillus stabekisii TaxID=241244 RepID=A0A143HBS8_9BACL|nr:MULTISPECIES: hypothetical protein [Rummeliibacillus]AMW99162.1 hypothetical protein ATY39_06620 [Rummeliibacillus stabekisii]